ncbi:hypothetical protein V6N11_039348 [Hibiscus sabdariffa]|uniref:Uncharacterized protein n=1 Tax=Hibiscus sabdariffa TaxID=183260 RepID=A0ABR2SN66_9ROSI
MQGLSGGSGGGANCGSGVASADPATDHLFASSPVPPHSLHPDRANSEHFLPFVPALQHHHHHQQQQMVAAAVGHPHLQSPYHRPQMGHFGSSPNSPFKHPFLGRQTQQPMHGMGGTPVHNQCPSSYVEDLESANANSGRKVLTLFPTGDD